MSQSPGSVHLPKLQESTFQCSKSSQGILHFRAGIAVSTQFDQKPLLLAEIANSIRNRRQYGVLPVTDWIEGPSCKSSGGQS